MIRRFLKDDSGVTSIEYALIGAFILCSIIGTLFLISPQMPVPFQKVSDGITAAINN